MSKNIHLKTDGCVINKAAYIESENVVLFIEFMANALNGAKFSHSFKVADKKIPCGYSRDVVIEKIEDAFDIYFWNGSDFISNHKILSEISSELRLAFGAKEGGADKLISAIERCMHWGLGVNSRSSQINISWAKINKESILRLVSDAVKIINSESPDTSRFNIDLRMNAGYTKVYSLICDECIIYDGRVGAALGLLVRKFYEARSQAPREIPHELCFRWGKARGKEAMDGGRNRNPSNKLFVFKPLRNDGAIHTEWNIKANWILSAAIKKSGASWCSGEDGLRRVESALFMIGYDMGSSSPDTR
jgi:hypothetical protein